MLLSMLCLLQQVSLTAESVAICFKSMFHPNVSNDCILLPKGSSDRVVIRIIQKHYPLGSALHQSYPLLKFPATCFIHLETIDRYNRKVRIWRGLDLTCVFFTALLILTTFLFCVLSKFSSQIQYSQIVNLKPQTHMNHFMYSSYIPAQFVSKLIRRVWRVWVGHSSVGCVESRVLISDLMIFLSKSWTITKHLFFWHFPGNKVAGRWPHSQ